ncbi:MAG TPA: hypothetical protein VKA53_04540, partial [Thermoanaerobaculia bacterium]|nr:hypothetical protein [Thermoanaerobaculia bacterium]
MSFDINTTPAGPRTRAGSRSHPTAGRDTDEFGTLEATSGAAPTRWRWTALALATLLALVVATGFWGDSYDDAFITYRYARNWQERGRLQYNSGERVYGTSAPGYALLLGSLARLTPAITVPAWGTLAAVASLLAVVLLFAAALGRDGPGDAVTIAAPAALALLLFTVPFSIGMLGAEAYPAAALVCFGTWLLFARQKQAIAGLVLAAAAVLRLDAGLAACALGVGFWLSRRRFPSRLFLAGVSVLAAYLALTFRLFGTVVPITLAVKRSELALAGPASYGASEWSWIGRALPTVSAWFLLALAGIGLLWLARTRLALRPPVLSMGAWVLMNELLYRVLGVPFAPWYGIY